MSRLPIGVLAWIAIAVLPAAICAACACYARSAHAAALFDAYRDRLERDLRALQLRGSARALIRAHAAAIATALVIAIASGRAWLLLVALLLIVAPLGAIARARRVRAQRIGAQLDTWLVVLANALRATPSLGQALDISALRIAAPLRDELRLTLNEVSVGVALDRALDDLGARVGSAALRAALTTLRVARTTGGDLSATLDGAAASLREIARLEGVIRTKTAEGRAQSLLIAVVPFPLCALLHALSPGLLAPLWSTPRGNLVLACALCLWLVALLLARAITAVEV